jgi:uncharacterized protein (DUF2062 family)
MKGMFKKLWDRLIGFLKSGITPKKLALTCALGVIVGTLPLWGITTLLCFAVAPIFRVNIVVLQLVHYFVYPIQLLLIIPFIKLGTYLFNVNPIPYALTELQERFSADFWAELKQVGVAISLGVGMWAIASIPIFIITYFSSLYLFEKWNKRHYRELKSQ